MVLKWRVCSAPDCGELVAGGGPCPRHRPRDTRASAAKRGYDAKWRRTRRHFLRTHPFCDIENCWADATDVHHLDGQGPSGPLGHSTSNLQALCKRHHSAITARMQPGGWARDGRPEDA